MRLLATGCMQLQVTKDIGDFRINCFNPNLLQSENKATLYFNEIITFSKFNSSNYGDKGLSNDRYFCIVTVNDFLYQGKLLENYFIGFWGTGELLNQGYYSELKNDVEEILTLIKDSKQD